ncbi:Elf4 domain-containing protein [Myxococcota bacterium]|nr:Elf4 domain-containing protein [Myxococcota bacterium]MBU1897919.1 Elf4 domain-containing protein [Myxococcota bacterium]
MDYVHFFDRANNQYSLNFHRQFKKFNDFQIFFDKSKQLKSFLEKSYDQKLLTLFISRIHFSSKLAVLVENNSPNLRNYLSNRVRLSKSKLNKLNDKDSEYQNEINSVRLYLGYLTVLSYMESDKNILEFQNDEYLQFLSEKNRELISQIDENKYSRSDQFYFRNIKLIYFLMINPGMYIDKQNIKCYKNTLNH